MLDWLARDFIASGWDVKRLCRDDRPFLDLPPALGGASAELRERDPDNLLLAHGPSRRLSAEDAPRRGPGGWRFAVAEEVGGPPVKPYQPPGMWHGMNGFLPAYVPDKGEGLHRRSLYTFWRRTSPPPNMLAFDAPSREVCVVRRQTTSTPLQPLVLLNDPQFVEAARGLGERLLREGGATPEERLAYAFRLAATRQARHRVNCACWRSLYQGQLRRCSQDPAGAQKFLKTGERPVPPGLDPAELAAAAATAGAILNLDASVTTR